MLVASGRWALPDSTTISRMRAGYPDRSTDAEWRVSAEWRAISRHRRITRHSTREVAAVRVKMGP